MKTHLSDVDIEAYRSRSATPEQLLAINDHLFDCDQCVRMFDSPDKIGRTYEAFRSFLEPEAGWPGHLDYEQLESFVDGTAGANTTRQVLAHMVECAECSSEIRDLKAIKEQIETQIGGKPRPAKRAGMATWWQVPGYRLAFGLAVFLGVLVGVVWTYVHRMQSPVLERGTRQAEEITAKPPAGIVLLLQDGGRQITRTSTGELLGLDLFPVAYVNALKHAVNAGRLPIPPVPETTLGRVGSLLGTGERKTGFDVVFPTNIVVEDTRPSFEWQRLAGATEYTVMIKDLASGAEIESPALTKTSWAPEVSLIRGHQYAWMVEAVRNSSRIRAPAPDKPFATFRVLDEQQVAEISRARRLYSQSHLGMGLAYAGAGLLREAEHEFSQLAEANPDSALAKNLLASVARKPGMAGR